MSVKMGWPNIYDCAFKLAQIQHRPFAPWNVSTAIFIQLPQEQEFVTRTLYAAFTFTVLPIRASILTSISMVNLSILPRIRSLILGW